MYTLGGTPKKRSKRHPPESNAQYSSYTHDGANFRLHDATASSRDGKHEQPVSYLDAEMATDDWQCNAKN